MKFTLTDYQADAVAASLAQLSKAGRRFREDAELSSVALTAATGAGKTVMAAAIIESLFFGSEEHLADPTATVLWFTADPSLNEQTRHRIMQASDRVGSNRLRVIESHFSDERLRPGHVYFLNSQKLSKNANLVKGSGAGEVDEMLAAPDMRARTFWEILANTIEHDATTLYVILDEAHIGMNQSRRDLGEKPTIVKTLVNGEAAAPAVPIVLGISATIDRFNAAMEQATNRTRLPDVTVDAVRVQESGLLKDNILLSFPTETGDFSTTLLREAVRRTRIASDLWATYHADQGGDLVLPLLVVQVPNKPSDDLLVDAILAILDEWPEMTSDNIAHVFGEGAALEVANREIAYVAPQDVAERTHIRVLLAKDAISTGWDCPRAEVLMSFRPAQDLTHITQLLGRMVRTPLARRIPGDDRLNAVECILPAFNRSTAEEVGLRIMGGPGGPATPPPIPVATGEFRRNPEIDEAVWEAFDRLPSQSVPRASAQPVGRFTALGKALAFDGLKDGAYAAAIGALVNVLRGQAVTHEVLVDAEVADILQMDGEVVVVGDGSIPAVTFAIAADEKAIENEYRAAARALSPQIANAYAVVLDDEYRDGFYEAHLRTAALARVPEVIEALELHATDLFGKWYVQHRVAIRKLSDARRAEYRRLKELAGEPTGAEIERPRVRIEAIEDADQHRLATAPRHLLSDAGGQYPIGGLLEWERHVVQAELGRDDTVAWYRNPSRASADALAIAYQDADGSWRRLCPDFVFFVETSDGIRPYLVDPHGTHLADALPKLKGLAAYAEVHASSFHRIEAVAKVDGSLRLLDFTDGPVRAAVMAAEDAGALYRSEAAFDYQ